MAVERDITPYSTIEKFMGGTPTWAPSEQDNERLAAYNTYEAMYWSIDQAFELIRRNDDGKAVYVPRPKMIVDTTAHFLLKGLTVGVADPTQDSEFAQFLKDFLARERFHSRFDVAKLSGVVRGDWVFHLTADPNKEEGKRISLNSIDPACYFPEFDSDDLEVRTGVKLVEQSEHPTDPSKTVVKVLRYWFEYGPDGQKISPLVWREENLWEMEGWNNPKEAKKVKTLKPAATLPTDITAIPVYHFKNAEWEGYPFGNSEIKGYERIFRAIDQAISDTEISLALVGLGVYATDAGRPRDSQGRETDWVVSPGTVWEMPGATMVKRLEGITSVTPVLDHVRYLEESLFDASGTSDVATGKVDVQTAESGIALALRFLPTLAKIEYRDTAGVEVLTQMWYDWKFWVKAYENKDYTATEIIITLGDKLPLNREKLIMELNNMLDRKVISRQYYRDTLTQRLDYTFPKTIEQDIIDEEIALQKAKLELMQQFQPEGVGEDGQQFEGPGGRKQGAGDTKEARDRNRSNNRTRTNESNGSEVRS